MANTYRRMAELSYEREMSALLDELTTKFDEWKEGAINWYDLNDKIHQYHSDDSRWVWKTYRRLKPRQLVVRAVVRGILQPGELPEEIRASVSEAAEDARDFWLD